MAAAPVFLTLDFMSALSPSMGNMSTSRFSPSELTAILDAFDTLPGVPEVRARTYDLLPPDGLVADVGCGAGRAVVELAARGVRAVGVDLDERMVGLARERFPGGDFRVGDACALPFGDGELRGYRADKVLHDLAEPGRALAEARRVLAPGGRAVLTGQDWDVLVIDSDDGELTRRIVRARADLVPSPRAARAFRALLLDAGFGEVAVEVRTVVLAEPGVEAFLARVAEAARAAGAVTDAEAEGWTAEQRERARRGRAFAAIPLFVASATR